MRESAEKIKQGTEGTLMSSLQRASLAMGLFWGGVTLDSDSADAQNRLKQLSTIPAACTAQNASEADRARCTVQFSEQLRAMAEYLKTSTHLTVDTKFFNKNVSVQEQCATITEWLPKHGPALEKVLRYLAEHHSRWFEEYATRIKVKPEDLKNVSKSVDRAVSFLSGCGIISRVVISRDSIEKGFHTHAPVLSEITTMLASDLQKAETPLAQRENAAQMIINLFKALNAAATVER